MCSPTGNKDGCVEEGIRRAYERGSSRVGGYLTAT